MGTQVSHIDPTTKADVVDGTTAPITSVCTSCHDGDDVKAHVETNTAPDGAEACPVCHQEGSIEAVSLVHASQ